MTDRSIVSLTVAIVVTVSACGGSDESSDATTTTDPPESSSSENSAPPPSSTDSPATTVATTPETTTAVTTIPVTSAAPATTTAPAPAPDAEPWQPIGPGPYTVGVATITLDDPARPLTVDVWFPIDAQLDRSTLAAQQYTLLPGVYYESPDARAASVDQLAGAAPFPLVVYSHGSGGLRYIHSSYTEGLAAHGYVVVAADHTGNTAVDLIAGAEIDAEQVAIDRPADVGRLIDAFVDPTHPTAGPYAASIDAERVAVTGHSFGGFTAITAVTGYANDLGEVPADPRVDAIVPLAPAVGERLTDELLATIDVPMMVLVGTDDVTTPVDPNVTRLWDATGDGSSPAYRVELVAAEHQTFTDICAYQDTVPTLTDVPTVVTDIIDVYAVEGCSAGDMDPVRATELTNSYAVRFLDQVFRGGAAIDSDVMATPDDVIFDAR